MLSKYCIQLDNCDPEDPDQDVHEPLADETQSWIGVIHIPVLEYYNARGSKACSVLERVCEQIFLLLLRCENMQYRLTFFEVQYLCYNLQVLACDWFYVCLILFCYVHVRVPKGFRAPGFQSKLCGAPGLQDQNIGAPGLPTFHLGLQASL